MGEGTRRAWLAAVCAALTALTLTSLSGCAGGKESAPAEDNPSSSQEETGGDDEGGKDEAKLADSLQSYIEQTLDQAQKAVQAGKLTSPSEAQLDILRRAKETGSMTQSDYEQAWSNYKQCVVNRGEPEPILQRFSNGTYHQAPFRESDEHSNSFQDAISICEFAEVIYIEDVYGAQIDNPNLYSDMDTAVVDCLHRKNLAPKGYTGKKLSEEWAKGDGKFSFDPSDPDARSCMNANGWSYSDQSDPVQELGQ